MEYIFQLNSLIVKFIFQLIHTTLNSHVFIQYLFSLSVNPHVTVLSQTTPSIVE